jgi:hypothetical protein
MHPPIPPVSLANGHGSTKIGVLAVSGAIQLRVTRQEKVFVPSDVPYTALGCGLPSTVSCVHLEKW